MNIISQLIEYGLSGREAKIYTCVLKNVEASAYVISQNTGIPRATVYSDLERLKKKGYIASTKKNGVLYFSAESLNRFKKNAEEKLSLSEVLIPQLRSLVDTEKFNPNIKSYIGINGMKLVFEDIIETLEQKKIKRLYAITDIHLLDAIPRYLPEWIKRRENLGVFTQMMIESSRENRGYITNEMREVRHFPRQVTLDCSINIYGDKIACFSTSKSESYSTIIESPTISAVLKQLFCLVWDSLEK